MYTVRQEKPITITTENGNVVVNYLMHIIVDTIADIPIPKDNWLTGSSCLVLKDGGHAYGLSHKNEWVEVTGAFYLYALCD